MAFLLDNDDEENQGSQPPSLAGVGGPSAPSGSGPTPGEAPSAPWQNIGSYLTANAPNVQNTANQLAQGFSQQYQDIQNKGQLAQDTFNQQINQGAVYGNEDLLNRAKSNPAQFVQNPNDVSEFQRIFNAQYGGPNSFSGTDLYSGLQGDIQKGQEKANLVNKGTSGIATLLRDVQKNPTAGMTSLDTLLIQQQPEAFNKVREAAQPFSTLNDWLSGTETSLNQKAQEAKTATEGSRNAAQEAFLGENGVIPQFKNQWDEKLNTARQKEANEGALEKRFLETGQLTPLGYSFNDKTNDLLNDEDLSTILSDLNLTKDQFTNLLNYRQQAASGFASPDQPDYVPSAKVNLADYLTLTPGESMSLQNALNSDDYATAQALSQLVNDPFIVPMGSPTPVNLSSFNYQGAMDSLTPTVQKINQAIQHRKDTAPVLPPAPPIDYTDPGNRDKLYKGFV